VAQREKNPDVEIPTKGKGGEEEKDMAKGIVIHFRISVNNPKRKGGDAAIATLRRKRKGKGEAPDRQQRKKKRK